jgi:apolipoprotein N-acyltransferase
VSQPVEHHQSIRGSASGALGFKGDSSIPTIWIRDFVFSGSSALLLSVARLFPNYWYFSFFALTPFLYRIIQASPRESFRLGFLFGLSFFGVGAINSLGISTAASLLKLLSGTALFAIFGWTVGCARQRWGFNPSLVAVLWAGLELGLDKIGFTGGLLGETGFCHPFLNSLVGLFGLLAASAVIVLLNSFLAFAIIKIIKATRNTLNSASEDERIWFPLSTCNLSTERVYLLPEDRAPPLMPKTVFNISVVRHISTS